MTLSRRDLYNQEKQGDCEDNVGSGGSFIMVGFHNGMQSSLTSACGLEFEDFN